MNKKDVSIRIVNILRKVKVTDDFMIVNATCLIKGVVNNKEVDTDKIRIEIKNHPGIVKVNFKSNKGFPFIKGYRLNKYVLKIDLHKIKSRKVDFFDEKFDVLYLDYDGIGSIKSSLFCLRKTKKNLKKVKCEEDSIAYLNTLKNNNLSFIKREKFSPSPVMINLHRSLKKENDKLVICGCGFLKLTRIKKLIDLSKLKLDIKDGENSFYQASIRFKYKKGIPFIKGYRYNSYKIILDIDKVMTLDIQNKLILNYDNKYFGKITYSVFNSSFFKYCTSNIIENNGKSIYLRRTNSNTVYLTTRESNIYDFKEGRKSLYFAKFVSNFIYKHNLILMFEKECDKYEESASVLFEKMIDLGYKNVYYILNKGNPKYSIINDKYKKYIIEKDSFKHLLYFFKCNTFIGTELLGHVIQLRASNRVINKKINSHKIKYVFLQHGVMYMVSLDADMRSFFASNNYKLHRVVVSSELEKAHFVDFGNFNDNQLYVTGVAKFDRCTRNKNADKIVVMPTWRRWEMNQASIDFTKTNYYKMLGKMVSAIPEEYLEKLIILPHPLMKKVINDNENQLSKYMVSDDIAYDDVLKECDVLITDYSSIAYDAFYRGAKVIFYWAEKDECMRHYGGKAHLMLNEDNVYGDVCYNKKQLEKSFVDNYMKEQKKDYIENYKKIVQFDDGKNSERIIKQMLKDKIIK